MAYLSDDLLTAIKRDSYLPTTQGNFTDAQMLAIADEKIIDDLAPLLVSIDQGMFVETVDQTITADTASYDFPQYAMWDKFYRIGLVDTAGTIFDLKRIDPAELANYQLASSGTPQGVYVTHKQLHLVPTPDSTSASTYSIRMWIYRRPGRLVATSAAAKVSSVSGGVVTYTAAPPSTHTSSSSHDFYNGVSPFRRVGTAISATAQSGSTQTFSSANAALLSASDYVCVADETVWPAVPIELHSHLKDLVIAQMANTQRDKTNYEMVRGKIMERARQALGVAPGDRLVSQPKKFSLWGNQLVGSWPGGTGTTQQ